MEEIVQVTVTTETREAALHLARLLVERRLAACVQIVGPITSVYRWQETVEEAEEWLCLAKTTRARYPELQEAVQAAHSYDVPELLAVAVTDGSEAYTAWLREQVTPER